MIFFLILATSGFDRDSESETGSEVRQRETETKPQTMFKCMPDFQFRASVCLLTLQTSLGFIAVAPITD